MSVLPGVWDKATLQNMSQVVNIERHVIVDNLVTDSTT